MKTYKILAFVLFSSYAYQTTSLHSANVKEYLSQKASAAKNWAKENPGKVAMAAIGAALFIASKVYMKKLEQSIEERRSALLKAAIAQQSQNKGTKAVFESPKLNAQIKEIKEKYQAKSDAMLKNVEFMSAEYYKIRDQLTAQEQEEIQATKSNFLKQNAQAASASTNQL